MTDAFATNASKIEQLQQQAAIAEKKILEYEDNLKELASWNHTLKFENKILKTAGKERDDRANRVRAALKEENEKLKQAIAKLTQQTAEHQFKIRKLAAKQASLRRRKEAAQQEGDDVGQQTTTTSAVAARAHQHMGSTAGLSEDMGSLAFSADSQDVVEENISTPNFRMARLQNTLKL